MCLALTVFSHIVDLVKQIGARSATQATGIHLNNAAVEA